MQLLPILSYVQHYKKYHAARFEAASVQYGLNQLEIDILLFLHNNPDCRTASDICRYRGLAKSNVSAAVERLRARGVLTVSPAPDNRRQRLLGFAPDALPMDDKAFRYWNTKTDSWEVEGGTYELRVGASSADIRLTAAVEVNGTSAPNPYAGKALPHYTSGKVQRVPDDEWETLLGRPIPADTVKIDRNMTLGELNHSRSPLCWLVWAVLTMMLNASYKRGKPNLNVMFQYNMPLRALAKMTSGAISMGMVDGIVLEAKGFWVIGLLKVIVEAVKNIILNAQLESRLRNS